MVYQRRKKEEVAKAMDVPIEAVDLCYTLWRAIREAYDRGDLVGARKLIDRSSGRV